jgi:hypothetical protein
MNAESEKEQGRELSHEERKSLASKQRMTLHTVGGASAGTGAGGKGGAANMHNQAILDARKAQREMEESQASLTAIEELLKKLDRTCAGKGV